MRNRSQPAISVRRIASVRICRYSGTRRFTHENSTLFKARKTVKLMVYPTANPMVCAVDAYDRFAGDNRVNAHPSTAISDEVGIVFNLLFACGDAESHLE